MSLDFPLNANLFANFVEFRFSALFCCETLSFILAIILLYTAVCCCLCVARRCFLSEVNCLCVARHCFLSEVNCLCVVRHCFLSEVNCLCVARRCSPWLPYSCASVRRTSSRHTVRSRESKMSRVALESLYRLVW